MPHRRRLGLQRASCIRPCAVGIAAWPGPAARGPIGRTTVRTAHPCERRATAAPGPGQCCRRSDDAGSLRPTFGKTMPQQQGGTSASRAVVKATLPVSAHVRNGLCGSGDADAGPAAAAALGTCGPGRAVAGDGAPARGGAAVGALAPVRRTATAAAGCRAALYALLLGLHRPVIGATPWPLP
jgi:hypothetical protein